MSMLLGIGSIQFDRLNSFTCLYSTLRTPLFTWWHIKLSARGQNGRYRFSAFWLRSKCSICSYQLNIWYVPHRGTSILNWFLALGGDTGACSGSSTGWPGIAVPPGSAHSPWGDIISIQKSTNSQPLTLCRCSSALFFSLVERCPYKPFSNYTNCLRPYHVENTSSRLITEVKQRRAWLVLGWVTAWEYQVL